MFCDCNSSIFACSRSFCAYEHCCLLFKLLNWLCNCTLTCVAFSSSRFFFPNSTSHYEARSSASLSSDTIFRMRSRSGSPLCCTNAISCICRTCSAVNFLSSTKYDYIA